MGGGTAGAGASPLVVPPRITDKLMVITEHGDRDQIAVLEEDVLVQHYVTRTGATSMVGNVYLGRVQNVLPGMEAAFVDIGRGRNGVLYAGEVNYRPEDLEGPAPAHRAGAEVRTGRHGAGHEGPDGRQGRAAHRADLAARPLPRLRARSERCPASAAASPTRSASG